MRALPFFRDVGPQTWKTFSKLRTSHLHSRGDVLFYEGNKPLGMFFLCRGRVKIVKSDEGRRFHITRIIEAPALVGDRAAIAQEPYAGTGEVMEESRVCFIEARHFNRLFLSEPGVWRELARRFAREAGQAEDRSRDIALKSIRARLAKSLLDRLPAHPKLPGGRTITLIESRIELAEELGTSAEAVCRTFAEFRRKGLISLRGRRVEVLNRDRLAQIARA